MRVALSPLIQLDGRVIGRSTGRAFPVTLRTMLHLESHSQQPSLHMSAGRSNFPGEVDGVARQDFLDEVPRLHGGKKLGGKFSIFSLVLSREQGCGAMAPGQAGASRLLEERDAVWGALIFNTTITDRNQQWGTIAERRPQGEGPSGVFSTAPLNVENASPIAAERATYKPERPPAPTNPRRDQTGRRGQGPSCWCGVRWSYELDC